MTVNRRLHGASAAGTELVGRLALRSRLASVGVVMILLMVSVFAIWSSQATAAAASAATASSKLSDDFAAAADAVAAEESLERKYRLEPGVGVRAGYDAAAANLVKALKTARDDGDVDARTVADLALQQHVSYLDVIGQLFTAVDRGETALVLRIDSGEVDPTFAAIETAVTAQAALEHAEALSSLHALQRLERLSSRLTPVIFLLGLLVAASLGAITRSYRRMLVTERAKAVHDSLHDALTGLPNRVLLADRFSQALRTGRRTGMTAGLLLVDLDRFKEINDTFGHSYGDELLAQIGPRLRISLHDSDTVARLGGDEFAVLLPDICDVATATAVAEKLRMSLLEPFRVEGIDLDVEASIGIVLSGEHGDDPATLLQRADIAMYVAKTQNLGVSVYDPDLDSNSPARLAMPGELRRALERSEIQLYYQPKVSVSTGEVVGVEALARWLHPTRGLVCPDDFIPVAEHTGLIGPLTRYVLNIALAQARVWLDAGRPLMVSVNLSARNLLDEQFPEQIIEMLRAHGVPPRLLEIEVTESAIMTEPQRARRLLEKLFANGIHISIDDFGAGYTSLGQLKSLPVSELKIDKSFVMNMANDHSDALIVRSVVDLGHNLGLVIVAEGVENAEALSTLARFGCDLVQGYYFLRPSPIATFDQWRAAHSLAALPTGKQLDQRSPLFT